MSELSYLTKEEKEALSKFKGELTRRFGKDLLVLKLFGSKVRGDFKKWPDSDIDVLIVLKRISFKKEDLIFKITTDILLKYSVYIAVQIFSRKEYEERLKLQVPFFLIIEKEGISL